MEHKNEKVALKRKGEVFALKILISEGWVLNSDYIDSLSGLDWVFEKNNQIIKVQVKTSLKTSQIQFSQAKLKTFDFLIFTDLKDLYIIPSQLINNTTERLSKTFKKLKNKYELLELSGGDLLLGVFDCNIKPLEIDRPSLFLHKNLEQK